MEEMAKGIAKMKKQYAHSGSHDLRVKLSAMQAELTRMQQERSKRVNSSALKEARSKWKKKEQALVADGKKPFFLKRSEKRKQELEVKFQVLKVAVLFG